MPPGSGREGRDEDELENTMAWVRHHDRYGRDEA